MAKTINITTSRIFSGRIELRPDGVVELRVQGYTIDDAGNDVELGVWVRELTDVSAGLRSDINGVMREFSENFNSEFANEPTATWIDQ